MRDTRENAVALWLRADLDKRMSGRISSCVDQSLQACRGYKLAKDRAARAGGEKIPIGAVPDARSLAPIVTDLRVVKRDFHEAREAHRAIDISAFAKHANKVRRNRVFFHSSQNPARPL
jgi:hypothetical protein